MYSAHRTYSSFYNTDETVEAPKRKGITLLGGLHKGIKEEGTPGNTQDGLGGRGTVL
jgi:hypothetical protein